jgi:hypothetical protein
MHSIPIVPRRPSPGLFDHPFHPATPNGDGTLLPPRGLCACVCCCLRDGNTSGLCDTSQRSAGQPRLDPIHRLQPVCVSHSARLSTAHTWLFTAPLISSFLSATWPLTQPRVSACLPACMHILTRPCTCPILRFGFISIDAPHTSTVLGNINTHLNIVFYTGADRTSLLAYTRTMLLCSLCVLLPAHRLCAPARCQSVRHGRQCYCEHY